jgi:two-component system, NtrC family, sensor kinase
MTRVLVVEDSPTQAQSLDLILQAEGYEVEIAPDAEKALERMAQQEFELALVDVHLPGESGVDLVKRISDEHPHTAAVIVTVTKASHIPHRRF